MSAPTIGHWLQQAEFALVRAGIEAGRLEARLLLSAHMKWDISRLVAFSEQPVTGPDRLAVKLERRLSREPLSHILGYRAFWKHDFLVNRDVLDPRPDSETLIEAVLTLRPDLASPLTMLDFGTGSGCLLLTLLSEYKAARGIGVDLSEAALGVARKNARRLGLTARCDFFKSNWGENICRKADLIFSNPPYIRSRDIAGLQTEIQAYEPHLALDGGEGGLDSYPVLTDYAVKNLNDNGLLVFEHGQGQESQVRQILSDHGFSNIRSWCDLGGVSRIVSGFLNL